MPAFLKNCDYIEFTNCGLETVRIHTDDLEWQDGKLAYKVAIAKLSRVLGIPKLLLKIFRDTSLDNEADDSCEESGKEEDSCWSDVVMGDGEEEENVKSDDTLLFFEEEDTILEENDNGAEITSNVGRNASLIMGEENDGNTSTIARFRYVVGDSNGIEMPSGDVTGSGVWGKIEPDVMEVAAYCGRKLGDCFMNVACDLSEPLAAAWVEFYEESTTTTTVADETSWEYSNSRSGRSTSWLRNQSGGFSEVADPGRQHIFHSAIRANMWMVVAALLRRNNNKRKQKFICQAELEGYRRDLFKEDLALIPPLEILASRATSWETCCESCFELMKALEEFESIDRCLLMRREAIDAVLGLVEQAKKSKTRMAAWMRFVNFMNKSLEARYGLTYAVEDTNICDFFHQSRITRQLSGKNVKLVELLLDELEKVRKCPFPSAGVSEEAARKSEEEAISACFVFLAAKCNIHDPINCIWARNLELLRQETQGVRIIATTGSIGGRRVCVAS